MNKFSLSQIIELVKSLPDNFNFHFEGRGNGEVSAIIEDKYTTLISDDEIIKRIKKNK